MTNRRQRIAKQEGTPRAPGRLSEMDTQEISFVDAPAIRRRFLVVKRAGGAPMTVRRRKLMIAKNDDDSASTGALATAVAPAVTPPPAEPKVEEVIEEVIKSALAMQVETAKAMVAEHLAMVDSATVDEGATVPDEFARDVQGVQHILKALAGDYGDASSLFLVPASSAAQVTKLTKSAQSILSLALGEADRRLEKSALALVEAEVMDPAQSSDLSNVADLLGGALSEVGCVQKAIVLPAEQTVLISKSIEDAMFALGSLRLAMVTKATKAAGGPDDVRVQVSKISDALRDSTNGLGLEPRPFDASIMAMIGFQENLVEDDGRLGLVKATDTLIVDLAKAATMHVVERDWDAKPGMPEFSVLLRTEPAADVLVSTHGSRIGADMAALKMNMTSVAKAAGEIEISADALVKAAKEVEVSDDTSTEEDDVAAAAKLAKAGAPMAASRLARLKDAIKLLKEGLSKLQAGGEQDHAAFKKALMDLDGLATEVTTTKVDVGVGDQPDATMAQKPSPANTGLPESVFKKLKAMEIKVAKQEERIQKSEAEAEKLRHTRAAPSTPPDDGDGGGRTKTKKRQAADPGWMADMTNYPSEAR